MENSTDIKQLVEMWKAWKKQDGEIDHSTVWKKAHKLAEAHYLPAFEFFVTGLSDSDWVWRVDCLSFLGFHYLLENHIEIVEKIRGMVFSDPSDDVRIAAASVLGVSSNLPDQALYHALEFDPNHIVRKAAFESILKLLGFPYKTISREVKRLKTSEIHPTLEYIKQIVRSENIEVPENLLVRDR